MTSDSTTAPRWIPALLILLSVLTVAMLALALGMLLDVLPSWSTEIGDRERSVLITPNKLLPIGSSVVGAVFVVSIFRRYLQKGGAHLLIWGIGLVFFATGSVTESIHGLFGWSDLVFRFWYLFGAVLIAAWMGQGTVHLLAPRSVAATFTVFLLVASAYASLKVFTAHLDPTLIASGVTQVRVEPPFEETEVLQSAAALLRLTGLDQTGQLSARKLSPLARAVGEAAAARAGTSPPPTLTRQEAGANLAGTVGGRSVLVGHAAWLVGEGVNPAALRTLDRDAPSMSLLVAVDGEPAGRLDLRNPIFFSGHVITTAGVRGLTPFFNTYGIITLIGGAIYSAWVFWRRRIMQHRAIGNILIATGAIVGGGTSAFSRFGMLSFLYLAELTSLILVFLGFVVATRAPRVERVAARTG